MNKIAVVCFVIAALVSMSEAQFGARLQSETRASTGLATRDANSAANRANLATGANQAQSNRAAQNSGRQAFSNQAGRTGLQLARRGGKTNGLQLNLAVANKDLYNQRLGVNNFNNLALGTRQANRGRVQQDAFRRNNLAAARQNRRNNFMDSFLNSNFFRRDLFNNRLDFGFPRF